MSPRASRCDPQELIDIRILEGPASLEEHDPVLIITGSISDMVYWARYLLDHIRRACRRAVHCMTNQGSNGCHITDALTPGPACLGCYPHLPHCLVRAGLRQAIETLQLHKQALHDGRESWHKAGVAGRACYSGSQMSGRELDDGQWACRPRRQSAWW